MRTPTMALLTALSLLLSAPAAAAANQPDGKQHGEGHRIEHRRIDVDWSAFPSEFQAYRNTLEQLKVQQRGLFEQFKQQRMQMRSAHQKLSETRRQALKTELKDLAAELGSARTAIHSLSEQKRTAWEQFHKHTSAKQWDAAKIDIQTVIAKKREIIAKQQSIIETQKKIVERMKK